MVFKKTTLSIMSQMRPIQTNYLWPASSLPLVCMDFSSCFSPVSYTATSPLRRKRHQIAIMGAIGKIIHIFSDCAPPPPHGCIYWHWFWKCFFPAQHHYRLIVYNCGFCPGLMLVGAEPEAMKSTAAMVALKAIVDPSAFLELNSTSEYIDLYRDSTSLPLGHFLIQLVRASMIRRLAYQTMVPL